jgi:hypothetical protein
MPRWKFHQSQRVLHVFPQARHHARHTKGFIFIQALIAIEVSASEMSVSFYQTIRSNNPEYSYLHIRSRENLKSHIYILIFSQPPLLSLNIRSEFMLTR